MDEIMSRKLHNEKYTWSLQKLLIGNTFFNFYNNLFKTYTRKKITFLAYNSVIFDSSTIVLIYNHSSISSIVKIYNHSINPKYFIEVTPFFTLPWQTLSALKLCKFDFRECHETVNLDCHFLSLHSFAYIIHFRSIPVSSIHML